MKNLILLLASALRHFPFRGATLLWRKVIQSFPNAIPIDCLVAFPEGYTMQLDTRDPVQNLMVASCYERRTTWVVKKILQAGDCFIDGGAYVGYYSCLAAACVGAGGVAYAFEPNPITHAILKKQAALNPRLSIQVYDAALSDNSRPKIFYTPPASLSFDGQTHACFDKGNSYNAQWHQMTVSCITIDEFIQQRQIKKITLCKLDLERGEVPALRGARSCLRTGILESLIIEVTEETKQSLADEMAQYDFDIILDMRFHQPMKSLRELKKIGNIYATNVLFARGDVAERWGKLKFLKWFV